MIKNKTEKTLKKNAMHRKLQRKEEDKRNSFKHKVPTSDSEVRALKRRAQSLIWDQRKISCRIKRLKRQRKEMNQEIDEIAKCMSLSYEL